MGHKSVHEEKTTATDTRLAVLLCLLVRKFIWRAAASNCLNAVSAIASCSRLTTLDSLFLHQAKTAS